MTNFAHGNTSHNSSASKRYQYGGGRQDVKADTMHLNEAHFSFFVLTEVDIALTNISF